MTGEEAGRNAAREVVAGMTPEQRAQLAAALCFIRPLGYDGWQATFRQTMEADPAARFYLSRVQKSGDPEQFFRSLYDCLMEFASGETAESGAALPY